MVGPTLPALLVVDRNPASLDVLVADLARRYGKYFAVSGEVSPEAALDLLRRKALARDPVALVLVDGADADLLARAHELHPEAKRVLLVDRDYTTNSPVVQTMTLGRADYHIVRPWADDEMLYGPMSDYLSSWTRDHEPTYELFRIVADDGDGKAREVRDLMTRLGMPYGSYAVDSDAGRSLLAGAGVDGSRLPVVVRYDGLTMIEPGMPELAAAIGVNIRNDTDTCDVAIVGAGPAGLTAAVYAASEGLDTVLLEQLMSGGQAGTCPLIRNYPGFPHGISGAVLMGRTCEQAWLMGAHIVYAQQAAGLDRLGEDPDGSDGYLVTALDGSELRARAVVLATGMAWRRLGVPGLEALVGSGVFYGSVVGESRAMRGQDVFIVGAGNSAGQAALHLAKHARSVTLLARGDTLAESMSSYVVRGVESTPNIAVRTNIEVVDGGGDRVLESITLADRATGAVEQARASALFVMIGGEPHTEWLPAEVARDPRGYVLTGRDVLEGPAARWGLDREPLALETSLPGVFAAGDLRAGSIKRVASAVGEGATTVRLIHDYLRLAEARAPAGAAR